MKHTRRLFYLTLYLFIVGLLLALFGGCWAEEVNMDIVIQIESGGNPNAYNAKSGAIGLCQITPICLKEYATIFGLPEDTIDLYNPKENKWVAQWYMNWRIPQMLKAYNIPDTIDNRLWSYNAGIGNVKKGICPRETKDYIRKYHKLEKGD